ncbi:YlxR family protein [Plantibacter sp. YIM 135249]|uniref:YlxR family protein n=1 Tax=Plantibacter sp. YIM 135249 TaxID=3423918 RepID=UPI003D357539
MNAPRTARGARTSRGASGAKRAAAAAAESFDGPVRTCVGCRKRGSRSELLRVVAGEDSLVADPSATEPGRGAWVHLDAGCFENAVARKAFTRALRLAESLDARLVGAYVVEVVERRSGLAD